MKTNPTNYSHESKQEKVFLEADELGVGRTKMIGYLTHIDPHIVN